ncbi:MAG TPA: glycoside hydrolase family 3 N-terminal domain-containing protein [Anaerohalosphaeraceae bacterium]|nr:glycoside hydrolase family 3 N-terminal domain-containing protein [Anaerohalosphaeraceae bacterium]
MKTASKSKPSYLNPSLPVEKRVQDLLSRMTLEEKVAQMLCVWNEKKTTLLNEKGEFDPEKAKAGYREGFGLGQVGRPSDAGGGTTPRQTAELTNAIQKFFIENSRLGIPVFFHEECLHGHAAPEATSFPQPIGLASTFDPELAERLYAMTAYEARVRGTHQALTPVVDVARDPRWGRVEETFGEDPYLAACMGAAAVRGFQGDRNFKDKKHLIATLKHFAAHGQPESGTNCAPVNVSMRILREVFLYPFKKCVEAGVVSVMASYNEIDGVPSHANRWLLREVLRKEWGFKGYVVSDYYAVRELYDRPGLFGHHVAASQKDAAVLAAKAGVNIELPEPDCYPHLVAAVREGLIEESVLDELIAPMLEWKFRMGLFEDPYVDPDEAEKVVGCQAHAQLALEAARKTITLLKNEGGLAPLDLKKIRTIAVIGPNADRVLLGGYSSTPKHFVTVLQGIRDYVGRQADVLYHEGCKITVGGSWAQDEVVLSDPAEDRKSIAEAVQVARRADVVILAVGGNEQTSREAYEKNHLGDRASLEMVGLQDELVNALAETGKPIIALLFNGRPLSVRNLAAKVPVIFECWYLGQEAGRAAAEVLFGQVNPSGKLPITFPRSVGHIPAYYNYKPSARRGYLFDEISPLFAFGYGLSYTTFRFENLRLEKSTIRPDQSTRVLVDVTNTGKRAGDEVVQMYIRDCVSSVTRPVKELKGFKRITLQPGQTQTVALPIEPEHLAFYDIQMNYTVEPGEFEIMVGSSSRDEDLQKVILTVQK